MEDNAQENTSIKETHSERIKPNGCAAAVEILMFFYYFCKTLLDTVVVNVFEKSTCIVILEYNDTNCSEPVSPNTESQLQKSASNLLLARFLIEGIFPSFLAIFIGPWSDTNGRRPLILLSLAGCTISSVIWCVLSLVPALHPIYFLFASVPLAFSGGSVCFYLGLYCYISDTVICKHRTFRMGLLVAADKIGTLLSTLVTPYILLTTPKYGYSVVFATSLSIYLLTFLYTLFYVPESVDIKQTEQTKLWRLSHVIDLLKICFKSRPEYLRTIIILLVANLGIYELLFQGEKAVIYMFTQKQFNWSLLDYTRLNSFDITVSGISLSCNTWLLTSVLQFSDMPLLFVGSLCLLGKALMQANATSPLNLFEATGFVVMSVLILPLSRSQLSKLIHVEDTGKIFAFISFVEALVPQLSSPIYILMYKATLDTMPHSVFWLAAGLSSISVLFIGLAFILLKLSSHEELRPLLEPSTKSENSTFSNDGVVLPEEFEASLN